MWISQGDPTGFKVAKEVLNMIAFKPGTYGYIAKKDLETSFGNITTFPNACALYAQQAVEKMLKQYIKEVSQSTDSSLLHSHNLKRLAKFANIGALNASMLNLYELTDAYYNTRYPGDDYFDVTPTEAEQFYLAASSACNIIEMEIEKSRI